MNRKDAQPEKDAKPAEPLAAPFSDQELGAVFDSALKANRPPAHEKPSPLTSMAAQELDALHTAVKKETPSAVLIEETKPAPLPRPPATDGPTSQLFHIPPIGPPPPKALSWSALPAAAKAGVIVGTLLLLASLGALALLLTQKAAPRVPNGPAQAEPTRSESAATQPNPPSPSPAKGADEETIQDTLKPAEIMAVVMAHRAGVERCVAEDEEAEGTLLMKIELETSGAVKSVSAQTDALQGSPIDTCLTKEIQTWTFPKHRQALPPFDFPFKL